MERDLTAYREVAVQVVCDERTGLPVVRPLSGQPFAPDMRVHGAGRLARAHPVGAIFLVQAKMTDRQGGTPFLYVYHGDPVRELTPAEAKRWLGEYRRLRI